MKIRPYHVFILLCIPVVVASQTRLELLNEDFGGLGDPFPPSGWTVESQGPGGDWAQAGNVVDAHARARDTVFQDQDERLISPTVDCSGYSSGLKLKWWNLYQVNAPSPSDTDTGFVDVSIDNGSSWTTLKFYTANNFAHNPDSVDVPQAANESQVKFRWRYDAPYNAYRKYWDIDDILFEVSIAHDVGVDSIMGPSTGDKLIGGRQVEIYARVTNYSTSDETAVPVSCSSSPAGYSSSTTIADLSAGETVLISFPDLWTVPTSGTYSLTAQTTLGTDGDPSNDEASAGNLVPVSFSVSNSVLLSWETTDERDAYTGALSNISVGYDNWDRGTNGNLYGLDAWSTVIFSEASGFAPEYQEAIALMRFIDEGEGSRAQTYLFLSGDNIGRNYDQGVLSAEFFEEYLHATCDGSEVSSGGIRTFSAPDCSYIGGSPATDSLSVDQTSATRRADELGADAFAETLYAWQWTPPVFPVAIQYEDEDHEHVFLGFNFSDITSSTAREALLDRSFDWFSGPPAPDAITDLSVEIIGTTVRLVWSDQPTWVCPGFRIYRDTIAYFQPSTLYQETDTSPFDDVGAAGDESINYFYRVVPVDFGVEGDATDTVGEIDFFLP
jgi:hypothetical protein